MRLNFADQDSSSCFMGEDMDDILYFCLSGNLKKFHDILDSTHHLNIGEDSMKKRVKEMLFKTGFMKLSHSAVFDPALVMFHTMNRYPHLRKSSY